MEKIRFIFWAGMKVLSLVFLGLVAAKAVAGLKYQGPEGDDRRLRWIRTFLYAVALALAIHGARSVGYDIAAEMYLWAAEDDFSGGGIAKAYVNIHRAIELRTMNIGYWRALALYKLTLREYASLLEDLPVFQRLSGGELYEEDAYRFGACYFFLGQYDKLIPLTQRLIRQNRYFAAPYVLQGRAYLAQKKYREAEQSFLEVLQMFPNHQAAVEGLAHTFYLAGNRAGALGVLNETRKYAFPPEARKRFEALKALYAQ